MITDNTQAKVTIHPTYTNIIDSPLVVQLGCNAQFIKPLMKFYLVLGCFMYKLTNNGIETRRKLLCFGSSRSMLFFCEFISTKGSKRCLRL